MKHLVFHHQDGSSTAVPVSTMSTVNVKTWTPPIFGDGAIGPQLVEDQTLSLDGVVSIGFDDEAPAGATVLASSENAPLEGLSDAQAAALDAQFETAPAPWEDDGA